MKTRWPKPPGTVLLFDSLFIDQKEVTNLDYLSFLQAIRRDSGLLYYRKALPDTTVWDVFMDATHTANPKSTAATYGIKLTTAQEKALINASYLRSPYFHFHPVVGVSFEQAKLYCIWRSRVMSSEETEHHYRLPTEEEWIYAASANLDTATYSFGFKEYEIRSTLADNAKSYYGQIKGRSQLSSSEFDYIFNKHRRNGREPFFNCLKSFFNYFDYGARQPLTTIDQSNRKDNQTGAFSMLEYDHNGKANDFGISGMIGNVAEMTTTKGLCKGGSWAHYLENCKISKQLHYGGPAAWVGFRCVCIVSDAP